MKLTQPAGVTACLTGGEQGGRAARNNRLRPERFLWKSFRTGVQLPPPPPNCEGTNPCLGRGSYLRFAYPVIPLDDGTFCVLAFLDDYGDHQSVVTRKATYRDIVRWVKETYGVHVKNIDIPRAKQRCGLAHMELDRAASPGYKPEKKRPDREALVIEAFQHFGMI